MVQQILDDLRAYFEAKATITPEEQVLLQRLKGDFFPITSVSRDDLQVYGFDTRSVTDVQMRRLAQKWQMITANSFLVEHGNYRRRVRVFALPRLSGLCKPTCFSQ